MAVIEIMAKIGCDGCGRQFTVEMDPGRGPTEGWSVFDYAEDAVRGGVIVTPHGSSRSGELPGSCSVQDDKMLCGTCTRVADEACAKSPTGKHSWEDDEACEYCGEPM